MLKQATPGGSAFFLADWKLFVNATDLLVDAAPAMFHLRNHIEEE
jgi:hypothetical protein